MIIRGVRHSPFLDRSGHLVISQSVHLPSKEGSFRQPLVLDEQLKTRVQVIESEVRYEGYVVYAFSAGHLRNLLQERLITCRGVYIIHYLEIQPTLLETPLSTLLYVTYAKMGGGDKDKHNYSYRSCNLLL